MSDDKSEATANPRERSGIAGNSVERGGTPPPADRDRDEAPSAVDGAAIDLDTARERAS